MALTLAEWLMERGSEASNSTGLLKTSFSNVPGAPKIAAEAAHKPRYVRDISVAQSAAGEAAGSAATVVTVSELPDHLPAHPESG
jgi:hypothetical protein